MQRTIPDLSPFEKVSVMSTTGLNGHTLDLCHFDYADGYERMGRNLAHAVNRDLYGLQSESYPDPPNVAYAFLSNAQNNEIVLVLRDPESPLLWNSGAHQDFELIGTTGVVTGGRVEQGVIRLTVSEHAHLAHAVTYRGRSGVRPWIVNSSGVGLLAFESLTFSPVDIKVASMLTQNPGSVSVQWESISGERYRVERTDDLVDLGWILHQEIVATSATSWIELPLDPSSVTRSYRVLWADL